MAWQQRSRRRTELPANWQAIRVAVLTRDNYACTIQGPKCASVANHVDHIDPAGTHHLDNLRAACQPCHMARTAQQAHTARPSRHRAPEPHPGLLEPPGAPTPTPPHCQYRNV